MSHFTPRYSQEQSDAIVDAVLVQGLTVPAACKKAEAGQLGLPAFTFNTATAYAKVQRAQKARDRQQAAQDDPRAALTKMTKSMVAMLHTEVENLANVQAKGKLDPERFSKWVRAAKELEALTRLLHVPDKPKHEASELVESLLNGTQHESANV